MLGLSNGGPMIRAAFAADPGIPVERVVTSGGPMGGSVETLACLDRGFQFAPLGRTVSPAQFIACPGSMQAIPSPRFAFVSEATRRRRRISTTSPPGATSGLSVFRRDPDDPVWVESFGKRLADMRETWRMLDAAPAPRRLVCICGAGLPDADALSSCARKASTSPARASWPASRPPPSVTATAR